MFQFQKLNSRRFERGFDRVNLHRLDLWHTTTPPRRDQIDRTSHIDMGDDHIDVVISHTINPYSISMSWMTISIW